MAVEGVSGETATPAFIFLPWMVLMREIASASHPGAQLWDIGERPAFCRGAHTLLLYGNSRVYHLHLQWRLPTEGKGGVNAFWIDGGSEKTLYLFRFGNHHVTIHENSWNSLSYAFQHRCTYAESLGNISTSRSGGLSRHTHRDIRHEMAEKFMILVI